jgi:hydrogenase maturation protease
LTENNKISVKPTLVIGIGNDFRCDDAAGIIAAKKLKDLAGPNIKILKNDGDGALLMEFWNGYKNVFLIDAVSTGAVPGTIHIIDANQKKFPKETAIHSSHMFSVAEAVETSRALNRLPENLIIFGIEGKTYDLGNTVSEEVKQSVEEVVAEIKKRLEFI